MKVLSCLKITMLFLLVVSPVILANTLSTNQPEIGLSHRHQS